MNAPRAPTQPDQQSNSQWYANAMEQLIEVVQLLSLARDLPSVMEIVRHAARRLTGADGATFVLRDDGKCFYAEEDAISPLWKGQRFPMSACISGWAMLNKQAAVIEDIYADPRIPADAYRPTFVHSLAMVPIRTIDPIGAIGNYWATRHQPTPEQVKVLQALADTTAVAMENVRIYEKLEQRVRQRTSELQSILDNVPVGIVFAVEDKLVRANPKVMDIFGPVDAAPPATLAELLGATEAGTALTQAARSHFTRNEVFISEQRLRQGERNKWIRLVARSLAAEDLQHSEIWVITDISERKEREQKLNELKIAAETANHAKDAFLATMSHEIRTPLTGMLGMMELLSLTSLDSDQSATLDAAWDSARGLLRIVNDILDWSKIEEGRLELAPHPASIRQVLQDVVNTYSRVASSKSLLLWQHADARLADAYVVDSMRLSQILNNFVSNAIKFTSQGEIELRADIIRRLDGSDQIRFSVKDTGIGIPKEVQDRLFQRYHQQSADTARLYGGTGLGLAICRRLADMMDGRIELSSEPEMGSTFSLMLTLPLSATPGETLPSAHPEVKQRDVKPLFTDSVSAPLVLAVDDHPVNRNLLARQLRLLGLRADTAENGKAALSQWRSGRYALVITDCHMPEMDGYILSAEMRKIELEHALPHTPVIAWTANAAMDEARHCRAAGMDDLLVKPANLAQLRMTLARWLPEGHSGNADAPAAEAQAKATAPIDYGILNSIVANTDEQLQVLADFRSHLAADMPKLSSLLEAADLAGTERIAHRMKGACQMTGAMQLAEIYAAIERAARKHDLQAAQAAEKTLNDALDQLDRFLTHTDSRKETS